MSIKTLKTKKEKQQWIASCYFGNNYIIPRDSKETLFLITKEGVLCNLKGYTILPNEEYIKLQNTIKRLKEQKKKLKTLL